MQEPPEHLRAEAHARWCHKRVVADRRWLTIWHGDWPMANALVGLVPEVTGERLGCQDIQKGDFLPKLGVPAFGRAFANLHLLARRFLP